MAVCCIDFKGIADSCETSVGGINKAYIACARDVKQPVVSATDGTISTITGSVASGVWSEFYIQEDTGSVVSTGARADTGNTAVTSVVSLNFVGIDQTKSSVIDALRKSGLNIIVEHNKGIYTYYGFDRRVFLTGDTMNTGALWSDFEGYNLTFTDTSFDYPKILSAAAVSALLAEAAPATPSA